MRISDWSSDVCSSDLPEAPPKPVPTEAQQQAQARAVAKNSGLLAMTDQLAELRDQSLHGLDTNRSLSSDRITAQAGTGASGGSSESFTASAASGSSGIGATGTGDERRLQRSEEQTSELQSLMRISYAV